MTFWLSQSTFKANIPFSNLGRQLVKKVFFHAKAIETNQKSVAQMVSEI